MRRSLGEEGLGKLLCLFLEHKGVGLLVVVTGHSRQAGLLGSGDGCWEPGS
jgi:hypothetical protein